MSQKTTQSAQIAPPHTLIPMTFVRTTSLDIWYHAEWIAGEWVTRQGKKNLSALQEQFADMALMTVAAFIELQNEKYCTPARELTQEYYIEQLEALMMMHHRLSERHSAVCGLFAGI